MSEYNQKLRYVGGTVSQVVGLTEILLGYFSKDNLPEKTVLKITSLRDKLRIIAQNSANEARQEQDEKTVETLYQMKLTEWVNTFDELILLIDNIVKTAPLSHIQEIEKIVESLKSFSEVKYKLGMGSNLEL